MSQQLRRDTFEMNELAKVEPPASPVILKSGGPIMDLIEFGEGLAVCEWEDGRARFPLSSLYRLVPFVSND